MGYFCIKLTSYRRVITLKPCHLPKVHSNVTFCPWQQYVAVEWTQSFKQWTNALLNKLQAQLKMVVNERTANTEKEIHVSLACSLAKPLDPGKILFHTTNTYNSSATDCMSGLAIHFFYVLNHFAKIVLTPSVFVTFIHICLTHWTGNTFKN